jgi:phage gp36-like protein
MYASAADLTNVADPKTLSQLALELTEEVGVEADPLADPPVEAVAAITPDEMLESILTDASNEIDSYICSRYVVPVVAASALPILKVKCLDIAKFRLFERRSQGAFDPAMAKLYDGAISWLKSVARRDAAIPGAEEVGLPPVVATSVSGSMGSDTQIWTDPNADTSLGML